MNIEKQKSLLRNKLLLKRQHIDDIKRKLAEEKICKRIILFLHNANIEINKIGIYMPIQNEVDITPVFSKLVCLHYKLLLPVIYKEVLQFKLWDQKDKLTISKFGIPIPADKKTIAQIPDIILIPLLGYDHRGNRLGYGKGYYDRTLDYYDKVVQKKIYTVGIAFSCQEEDKIPTNTYDKPLNYIITETECKKIVPQI